MMLPALAKRARRRTSPCRCNQTFGSGVDVGAGGLRLAVTGHEPVPLVLGELAADDLAGTLDPSLRVDGCRCSSVHDVEGVTQGVIQSSSRDLVQVTDGFVIEVVEWDRDDVVAADDTRLGEPVLGTELDFRFDAADGARDRCACDCREHLDRGVAGQYTDRSATGGRSEVDPVDVVAGCHAGAVSAASLRADWTSAGSASWRR